MCHVVKRLVSSLMMHGRNNGQKLMAVRIVKHAFEFICLLTGDYPIPKFWSTPSLNSGPGVDSTRIGRAGTLRHQVVDVPPECCALTPARLLSESPIPLRNAWLMIFHSPRSQEEGRVRASCQVQPIDIYMAWTVTVSLLAVVLWQID